jgi:hypothetical protein
MDHLFAAGLGQAAGSTWRARRPVILAVALVCTDSGAPFGECSVELLSLMAPNPPTLLPTGIPMNPGDKPQDLALAAGLAVSEQTGQQPGAGGSEQSAEQRRAAASNSILVSDAGVRGRPAVQDLACFWLGVWGLACARCCTSPAWSSRDLAFLFACARCRCASHPS